MMETSRKAIEIVRLGRGGIESVQDYVSIEEPLEIQIIAGQGRVVSSISVTMRTPGRDLELAVGFLFTEGIVSEPKHVIALESISENIVRIGLDPSVEMAPLNMSRNFYSTSSCGVCGKASIDAIKVASKPIKADFFLDPEMLQNLPAKLLAQQENFKSTGGLHASALFTRQGGLKSIREDVGRHNALDKLIGNAFLKNEIPMHDSVLLVSGRLSFELVQKAAVAGVPFIAAIGAPSSLAIELAQDKGITLVGFLNSSRFNIYTHQNRVLLHEQSRV